MSEQLDSCNVVWDYPSGNSSGSMPLGNGEIGVNVWAVEGGDIVLYIAKTDAWSENGRLFKLGRVRIKLSPNPIRPEMPFRQELVLKRGEVEIVTGPKDASVKALIWVDADNPVVHVEVSGERALDVQATLEVWRNEPLASQGDNVHGLRRSPHPYFEMPDTVLPARNNSIAWFHQNRTSIWSENLKIQGLEDLITDSADPLLHRIFGGIIKGDNLVSRDDCTLASERSSTRHVISIYPLTVQAENPEDWLSALERSIADIERRDIENRHAAHCAWWSSFWERSRIFISGDDDAKAVTEGYVLQRFINACAGRGDYPIKFNGSIFNVDTPRGPEYNADYRQWGESYWEQNTRLIYWSMPASGDHDMMRPLFKMYNDALPLAGKRTEVFFGHEGAYFPETMYFWGAYQFVDYGWNREGKRISDIECRYIQWYYQGNLEILALAFDYYEYTQDADFLRDALLPMADEILMFYEKHFPLDENGHLRIYPAQALETYLEVVNPSCEIAGLIWVLEKMLSLPENALGSKRRDRFTHLLAKMPPIPMETRNGETVVGIAERIIEAGNNIENPELYSVFPYRLYTIGKPDLELGQATFKNRLHDGNYGWCQNDIFGAYLGLADYAKQAITKRFRNHNPESRFPAFWGRFDWTPDQDHGCVGVIALQRMLIQSDGGKIYLFPAWPKSWDVEFKLWAPERTVIEGIYKGGKLESITVTPESRAGDVVVMGVG